MTRLAALLGAMVSVALLGGCADRPLTAEEAKTATAEAALSTQAEQVSSAAVEIATQFTIGSAVEAALEEIRSYIASQLPCAEVTLGTGRLDLVYGANPGGCTYRGQTFRGRHSITVRRDEQGRVIVDHEWERLSNQIVEVSGTATVTLDFQQPSRHVVHSLDWARLTDGRTGHGTGDRVQVPLESGVAEGIRVDGTRSWTGQQGRWELSINGVELRWVDPVPQAGSYSLDTPFDKTISLFFTRLDADTIQVTVEGPRRSYRFRISKLGSVE